PAGATHLVVVADPSNAISESKEDNNSASIPLSDIAMLSATTEDSQSVTFQYEIANASLNQPFQIRIYRSKRNQFDPNNDIPATDTITITPEQLDLEGKTATELGTHLMKVPAPLPLDLTPNYPY